MSEEQSNAYRAASAYSTGGGGVVLAELLLGGPIMGLAESPAANSALERGSLAGWTLPRPPSGSSVPRRPVDMARRDVTIWLGSWQLEEYA